MDSKITKKRLSNFFQYEWIVMAIVVAVAIILMELIYSVSAVRLGVGQSYKIFYDENIFVKGTSFEDSLYYGDERSVFSYDVLEFSTERLVSDYNVLYARLGTYEGDIIFTDNFIREGTTYDSRANSIIDDGFICHFEKLLEDAKSYLKQFLVEGKTEISIENLDESKITSHFLERQKKDNRFRSDEEKDAGKKLEIERIKNLISSYLYFDKAYKYGVDNGWFYKYTKYDYFIEQNKDGEYEEFYRESQQIENEKPRYYGLYVNKLNSTQNYVSVNGENMNNDDIVLMVFDFVKQQSDLQFESFSVINRLIQNCTGYKTVEEIPTI